MKLAICVLVLIFGLCQGATITDAPKVCMSDVDCTDNECCQKDHDFLVVSKKRQNTFEGFPLHNQDLAHKPGVCMPYLNEGDACNVLDHLNGYCSCNTKQDMACHSDHNMLPGSGTCKHGLLLSKK